MDDKIITKVQNLLELAYDAPNDEEGQTALLMAQKLMVKHQLSMGDIEQNSKNRDNIGEVIGTQGKRIPWWQERLAAILASNFRCQTIRARVRADGITQIKFFGYYQDAELCTKVYEGAILYLKYRLKRLAKTTTKTKKSDYRKSYLYGFLTGLDDRFEKQVHSSEEFALAVQVPIEVDEELKSRMGVLDERRTVNPKANELDMVAFSHGYHQASEVKLFPDELLER